MFGAWRRSSRCIQGSEGGEERRDQGKGRVVVKETEMLGLRGQEFEFEIRWSSDGREKGLMRNGGSAKPHNDDAGKVHGTYHGPKSRGSIDNNKRNASIRTKGSEMSLTAVRDIFRAR